MTKQTNTTWQQAKKEESGVALLITLGILAMILVLALGFAASALTTRKAAANSNDLTVARLLAESAVQRALGAMRYYSTISLHYDNVISHDEIDAVATNQKNFDFLYRLGTAVDSCEYEWEDPYDPDDTDAVHWQYVYNGLAGGDKKIIGRIAYVTVDSEGKIDPAACVAHGGTPPNENGANEERNGANINEINISYLDPANATTYLSTTEVSNFSSDACTTPGTLPDGTRWPDWETLFSASKLNIADDAGKDYYRAWFVLDAQADPEAFWIDSNADGVEENGEYYHRFNIARTDWDTLAIGGIIAAPTLYSDVSATHDGTGLKWLNNWTGASTFTDVAARKNQLAANLIDFCDTNSIATTDDANAPTYTGLEMTPYINEIGVELECTTTMTNVPGPEKNADMDFQIRVGVELVNMYTAQGANFSGLTEVTIDGNVYADLRAESGQTDTLSETFSITFNPTAVGAATYLFTWDNQTWFYNWNETIQAPHKVWAENAKCQITKVKLNYGGNFADFSYIDDTGEWSTQLATFVERDNHGVDTMYFHWEADDPRQNLNYDDWAQGGHVDEAYGGTNSAVNSSVSCTTDGDAEAGSSPTTISTAFIRNGPMQSPWDLGFIHRGEKWATLNLKAYDDSDGNYGVLAATGGGTYANGDANILDEIKMTSNIETYGMVSINATNQRILRALLGGIRYEVEYPNDGPDATGGTADDDSPGYTGDGTVLDYNTDVTNIAAAIAGNGSNPFKTRAHVAKVSKLSDGSEFTQDNDILKEEIISKFVNLTKIGATSSTITIIALAQAIKDVGNGITISKDLDQDGDVDADADETACGFDINGDGDAGDSGISETITGCAFGTYDQYADEILAEQKVMATVYRNPITGKWKIIRFEYLED